MWGTSSCAEGSPMSLTGLLTAALADPALALLAPRRGVDQLDVTAPPALRPFVAAALESLVPPSLVAVYPAWETLPHERLSPRSDTVGRRLAVLRRLAHPAPDDPGRGPIRILVAPVRAVLQPQLKGLGDLEPLELTVGDTMELETVVRRLTDIAYARVDLVTKRGEFAVRGGILDVFPPTDEHPVRVEFWGDDVEEIRTFAVADQRALGKAERLWAPPCRELLLTDAVRARARELSQQHPQLAEILDRLAEGIPIDVGAAAFRTLAQVRATATRLDQPWWSISPFGVAETPRRRFDEYDLDEEPDLLPAVADDTGEAIVLAAQPASLYHGETGRVVGDLKRWTAEGWRVALVFEGHGPAQRAVEVLHDAGLGVALASTVDEPPPSGQVTVACGMLGNGFLDEASRLALITGTDISGGRGVSTRDMRKLPSRRRNQIDPLELRAGDYVVHEQHGIGRYIEMVQRTVNGADREYLVIEYAPSKRGQPGDRLYVPTDQLDQLSRYVGGENPTLHKLGGADWQKSKARARSAVREIAAQLIQLYAARQSSRGHTFGPDTPWQRELEDAFQYTETPDQLAAIEEVKRDMEQPIPMDRLICGDVGYGKTEIAVRAAFKAVQDGKQAAILVPTTLLAQQHFNTFSER